MAKFIRVTEKFKNGATREIILNADRISSVCISDNPTSNDTHICMDDKKYFFVKQSVDAIWHLITGYTDDKYA